MTAFAAHVREHARNKQYLSQKEVGLRQRAGVCPTLLNPPAFCLQDISLYSLVGGHAGASSPGTRWSFKSSVCPIVWNKTMDFVEVSMQQEDFGLPGLDGGHLIVCQKSVSHKVQ